MVAPPYDVLSEDDVSEYQGRSEHNISHVDVPRGGADRWPSRGALRRWRRDGVLVCDPQPSFTIYRLRFTDASGTPRDVAGVLEVSRWSTTAPAGCCPMSGRLPRPPRIAGSDPGHRGQPVPSLGPVAGERPHRCCPSPPKSSAPCEDGVEHVVERVTDPTRIAAISAAVASDDVLIADGHHRYAISRVYRDDPCCHGRTDTPAELTLAFVSELVEDQLSISNPPAVRRHHAGDLKTELGGPSM